jgi:DNA ligase (NAD+)
VITLEDLDLQNLSPEELGELLIEAKKAYYTSGKPIMDDHTYDTLEEILKEKNPYHRIFEKVGNPNFDTGFSKKAHSMPMGSQNKVATVADLLHYFELKKIPNATDFLVQPKCDGISLEIEYRQGRVVDAITRGDGEIGDVVTQNVVKMQNFKEVLNQDFTGSIRCEIVVTAKDFQKLNHISSEDYANPRNAASGLTQRLDGKYTDLCTLLAVDIYPYPPTEQAKVNLLKNLGITTVDSFFCPNIPSIETIYQQFLTGKRSNYPFDIDGLVIKINDVSLQQKLGSHNNRPKGQVAYKFPAETNQTRIISVAWQVGPLGTVTPVAQVEPIQISGAVVTFASLANPSLVKQKDINTGDIVQISRRGDVIPHIENVVSKVNPGHIDIPTHCPACHTLLEHEYKYLRCPNTEACLPQILGGLRLFCDVLDIKGISDKTITKLYTAHRLRRPGDFYHLTIADFVDLEGLGEKSGANIIHQIQSKRKLTLKKFFTAAAIPNFSSARIQQLISAGFDSVEKIFNLTPDQLESLPGIQSTLAQKIYQGIQKRSSNIQSLIPEVTIISSPISHHLSGQTFVITGELSRPRPDIIKAIESAGGKVSSSVSTHTDYLVTNQTDSRSSKYLQAKKLGTKIINESELDQLLR